MLSDAGDEFAEEQTLGRNVGASFMANLQKTIGRTGRPTRFETGATAAVAKRMFDIVGSIALILFMLPLMLLIAAVLYTRVGPNVIYAHKRIGKDGSSFGCLKFRTMYLDADKRLEEILRTDPAARAEWEATRKMKGDKRILPGIGSFLRKSSLDELPQLFNVLAGQMSLVGPRPVVADELHTFYGEVADLYCTVRPGMTGPWQVGERSDDDYPSRVAKDANYIRNWSFQGDIMILLRTLALVTKVRGNGAY